MSLWRRFVDAFAPPPVRPGVTAVASPDAIPKEPSDELRAFILSAIDPDVALDERGIEAAFAELCRTGHEADALTAIGEVIRARSVPNDWVSMAARRHATRGDDGEVATLLERHADSVSTADLMLLADACERLGRTDRARVVLQRALGRDVRAPGASERLVRLGNVTAASNGDATLVGGEVESASRYRVLASLGRGGAGTVLLAEDLALGRRVALKVYHSRTPASLSRLFVEARTAARFEHVSVVRILDLDPVRGAIVMEPYERGSLATAIERRTLCSEAVLTRLRGLARTLALVHAGGIVHRDVKTSNVLLSDAGLALSDFGLARPRGAVLEANDAHEGTQGVVPPEARPGVSVEPAFDVFALGKVLGEVAVAYPEHARVLKSLMERCQAPDPLSRPGADAVEAALR